MGILTAAIPIAIPIIPTTRTTATPDTTTTATTPSTTTTPTTNTTPTATPTATAAQCQQPERQADTTTFNLPAELEWAVFESAVVHYPQCIPRIVLVARRFRTWFEPELYRVIRSGEGRVRPPLYTTDGPSAPLDLASLTRFGPHVRHVLLQKRTPAEISSLLSLTPNITNLALWIIRGSCAPLLSVLGNLKSPLRRLSFDPSYFFENYAADLSIPFGAHPGVFAGLTHLEIINATSAWSKWRQLSLLPHLSHLALAGMVNQSLIDQVLRECKTLEVFVMFYMNIGLLGGEVRLPQADARVVLLKSVSDHLDYWERAARGEVEDFWETAERIKREAVREALRKGGEGRMVSQQGGKLA